MSSRHGAPAGADKTELFAAVFETVEAEVIGRVAAAITRAKLADPIAAMRLRASTRLDACGEPEIHQIALLDAPAVLGWRAGARSRRATA